MSITHTATTASAAGLANYGRVGTGGRTSAKDQGTVAVAPAEAEAEPVVLAGPRTIEPARGGERRLAVRLTSAGAEVRTEVTETYGSPAEAAAAFARIAEAMTAEGYQSKP